MKQIRMLVALVAVLVLVFPQSGGAAQKKSAKQQGKKKTPSSAEAKQSVTAATRKVRDAEGEVKALAQKAEAAGKAAARRCLESSGLGEAQGDLKRAQAEFNGVKSTLVGTIHGRSDWLAATEEAGDARGKLRALNEEELAEAEKRKRRTELGSVIGRPREIEERELAANPGYRKALEKLNRAASAERNARTRYARDLAKDEEFKAAKAALAKAQQNLEDDQKDLGMSQRELLAAQRAESQAKQAEQAKKKQQANQKKKNNNKGKTKGKGKK